MLVYYFLPFIVNNCYLLFQVSNGHNSVTVLNRTHVHMNFFAQNHSYYHFPKQCRFLLNHPVCTESNTNQYLNMLTNYNKQSKKYSVNTTYTPQNSSSYLSGGYRLDLNVLFYGNSSLLCFQPIQPTNNPAPQYILQMYTLHYTLCWKIIYLLDLLPKNATGVKHQRSVSSKYHNKTPSIIFHANLFNDSEVVICNRLTDKHG